VTDVYKNATVGVVVPAHNEESFIGKVVDSVPEFVDRLYVVDDCSTDDTWTEIKAHATGQAMVSTGGEEMSLTDGGVSVSPFPDSDSEFDRMVVPVSHSINRGRGGAVKTGYHLALVEDVDIVAVMDGDGQMDPDNLHRMLDPILEGEADYTKGNRLVGPDHWEEMSNWRLFGNFILTALTRIASGYYRMRDPQNGFTAVSVKVLDDIALEDVYEDYGFLNDMLVRLGAYRKQVVDVPMEANYNDEESGIRYYSFIPALSLLLLRMFLWRLWVSYGFGSTKSNSQSNSDRFIYSQD